MPESPPRASIVTGAGSGIGRALALRLARDGDAVALLGRNPETLARTRAQIRNEGGRCLSIAGDIRNFTEVQQAVTRVVHEFGTPRVLVNNAGGQFPAAALSMSVRAWSAVLNTNLTGTFLMSQAFARAVVHASLSSAVILNMTIPWYERACRGLSHAVAARAGTVALTRTLAVEWAPYGIRVNCIAPGIVDTEGLVQEEFHGDTTQLADTLASIPLGRAANPDEVAEVMALLVSDAMSYMTGHTLRYDGGISLGPGLDFLPEGGWPSVTDG